MFEENGTYENRKGKYTVLSINEPKMTVRYEDGTEADLNIHIQARIWENILVEREAKAASRKRTPRAAGVINTTNHFIKVISIPPGEELSFPGWEELVVMVKPGDQNSPKKGDRLIYYAMEEQVFFAVATVTEEPFEENPKKYTYTLDIEKAIFFHIDIDAASRKLETGVPLDSIELESCPGFGKRNVFPEVFYVINEDDFELLSEALTEVSEEEEEEDDDDFEDDEDE